MCNWGGDLADMADWRHQTVNGLWLCPNHHRTYDKNYWTFAVRKDMLEAMIQYEHEDWERRSQKLRIHKVVASRKLLYQMHESNGLQVAFVVLDHQKMIKLGSHFPPYQSMSRMGRYRNPQFGPPVFWTRANLYPTFRRSIMAFEAQENATDMRRWESDSLPEWAEIRSLSFELYTLLNRDLVKEIEAEKKGKAKVSSDDVADVEEVETKPDHTENPMGPSADDSGGL
ncbi:hypothetical protein FRB90_006852, partial [Tulasnella sp. 427]